MTTELERRIAGFEQWARNRKGEPRSDWCLSRKEAFELFQRFDRMQGLVDAAEAVMAAKNKDEFVTAMNQYIRLRG